MEGVLFDPWKGDHYRTARRFGIRVMILGESHYDWKSRNRSIPLKNLTKNKIEDELEPGDYVSNPFYRNVLGAFLGAAPTQEERSKFWHSVLVYNFIQRLMSNSKERPTSIIARESEEPFRAVLANYRPQLIAVFGYQLWEWLPDEGHNVEDIVVGALKVQCYNFDRPSGVNALAVRLHHPSRAFSFRIWHLVLREALQRAGGHLMRCRRDAP
jgi:hypothetical protein